MQFPIVLIPTFITGAKTALPEVLAEPLQPKKPERSIKGRKLYLALSAFFLFTCLYSLNVNSIHTSSSDVQKIIFMNILGLAGIIIVIFWLSKTRKQQDKNYDHYLNEITEIYPKLMKEYESYLQQVLSNDSIKKFQEDSLISAIKKTSKAFYSSKDSKKGKSEFFFLEYLYIYFSNNIISNVSLGYFENPYMPDFVYLCHETGLHIDIEIDEPYIAGTNQPIHYVGADDKRNNFFINHNWVIIRFAEEQVVKYPDSCCKEVAKVIHNILGDKHILSKFEKVVNLPEIKQWTFTNARELARNNYRESY